MADRLRRFFEALELFELGKCSPVVALLVDTEAKTVAVRRRKLCVLR